MALGQRTLNSGRRTGGVLVLIIGSICALITIGLLAGGGFLMWADRTQRDASGYLASGSTRLASSSYAVVATDVNIALSAPDWPVAQDALGTVRIRATSVDPGNPVFIGIASRSDVTRYLQGTGWDQLTNLRFAPFGVTYQNHPGGAPASPQAQSFWVARASGAGTETLAWKAASGQWAIVLMNAGATPAVSADVAVGATAPMLFGLSLGLLIAGGVALLVAALLLVAGARLLHSGPTSAAGASSAGWLPAPPPPPPPLGPLSYPLRIEGTPAATPSRWLWLVKWFLLIPHFIVLIFLIPAMVVLTIVAGVAILCTGHYPRSIFDFNVAVMRWWWRVGYYGYSALGTDQYPPFSFSADAAYPATLDVPYPERLSRGLVLVKWLLAIPHYVVLALLLGGTAVAVREGIAYSVPYTGLITVLVVIAGFAMLFTTRYPAGIFDLVMGLNRWVYRVMAYVLLMRDEYPPFRLDLGGVERPRAAESQVPASPPPLTQPGVASG